jgi:carboxylesterase
MKTNGKNENPTRGLELQGGRCGVLLIHSLGGNPIELRFAAQSLARSGFTVHSPLLHGLGGGTDLAGLATWRDWYETVEKAYDKLRETCDVVIVGGMSAGAMLALRLASEKKDGVNALMLFAPTLWPNGWSIPWTINLFRLVHTRFVARMFSFQQRAPYGIKDERIRKFVIDSFKGEGRENELFDRSGHTVFQFRRLVGDVKKRLSAISQPTFIVHPRFDDQSDLSNAQQLQRKLGGIVETLVLDDSYHMVTLDRQRGLAVDRAVEFAERQVRQLMERNEVKELRRRASHSAAAE